LNEPADVVVHEEPAWRDQANFIIAARIDPNDPAPRLRWEQLWARQLSDTRFVNCCIPFFIYDLALGDEIEVGPLEERRYVMQRVVRQSGRYTFRVWFKADDARDEVAGELERLGCLLEWRFTGGNLLAVDAASDPHAQQVAGYLYGEEQQGRLVYETGRTA
jgi:hypothetical protein